MALPPWGMYLAVDAGDVGPVEYCGARKVGDAVPAYALMTAKLDWDPSSVLPGRNMKLNTGNVSGRWSGQEENGLGHVVRAHVPPQSRRTGKPG